MSIKITDFDKKQLDQLDLWDFEIYPCFTPDYVLFDVSSADDIDVSLYKFLIGKTLKDDKIEITPEYADYIANIESVDDLAVWFDGSWIRLVTGGRDGLEVICDSDFWIYRNENDRLYWDYYDFDYFREYCHLLKMKIDNELITFFFDHRVIYCIDCEIESLDHEFDNDNIRDVINGIDSGLESVTVIINGKKHNFEINHDHIGEIENGMIEFWLDGSAYTKIFQMEKTA
jgi:hypothetical protein